MKVSKGALVAGGVGLAVGGTLVARRRSRRRLAMSGASDTPTADTILADTILADTAEDIESRTTGMRDEPPGNLAQAV